METPIPVSASYTSVVVLLGLIAALFFKFSPIRHEQVSSNVLRNFMRYFIVFAVIFLFHLLRVAGWELLSIVLVNASYLVAVYSLRNGLKWRLNKEASPLYEDKLFVCHIILLVLLNAGVFYIVYDSILIRVITIHLSCCLIYLCCIKDLSLNPEKLNWGESVTRYALYAAASISVFNCLPLLAGADVKTHISFMMVTHSILILLMTGALLSLLLSDVVILHYQNSVKDPLTGLYNRRYFSSQAEVIQESSKRYEFPVSLVLCDIDNFKSINDTFGHEAGDYVIKDFASKISGFIREGDLLARFGGEEFVLLLPQTKIENAQRFAERLRLIIEQSNLEVRGKSVQYTASFGVSQLLKHGDLDFSLNAADEALYRAKNEGRNKVIVSPLAAVFS